MPRKRKKKHPSKWTSDEAARRFFSKPVARPLSRLTDS